MKLSIRKKAIIMIIVFAFVLITLSTFMYARVIVNLTTRLYSERTQNLAGTTAEFLDADAVAALRDRVETVYRSVDHKVFSDRWGEDDWNEYMRQVQDLRDDAMEGRLTVEELAERYDTISARRMKTK